MFLEFVFTSYIFHSLMSRTGFKKKKRDRDRITSSYQTPCEDTAQDRDKYKKKHPDI